MPIRPYVGVAAVTSAAQVKALIGVWPMNTSRHLLMIGVYAAGSGNFSDRWPGRFPDEYEAPHIFQDDPRCLNLIQLWSNYKGELARQLAPSVAALGPHVHGCQLNLTWPEPKEIERLRVVHPDWKIALQVGAKAIDEASGHPDVIAERLRDDYSSLIDYAVIDTSGYLQADERFILNCAEACLEKMPHNVGFCLSGGYDEGNVASIRPIAAACGWNLSICGNGRIRNQHDELVTDKARRFVHYARHYASSHVIQDGPPPLPVPDDDPPSSRRGRQMR